MPERIWYWYPCLVLIELLRKHVVHFELHQDLFIGLA